MDLDFSDYGLTPEPLPHIGFYLHRATECSPSTGVIFRIPSVQYRFPHRRSYFLSLASPVEVFGRTLKAAARGQTILS